MLLNNLILLLQQNKEHKSVRKEVVTLILELLKNEKYEKDLLAVELNLIWVIYDDKEPKLKANDAVDKLKLLKLEGSENSNLKLMTKDLIQLIESTFNFPFIDYSN